MKLNIKTIIGFVVIAVVAYLCRPINDKIANVFIEDKNDKDMEISIEEEETATIESSNDVEDTDELKISDNIDGHDYVDLGLSVEWATCNIGATKPEEYGDYFAWGETETKDRYESETYSWKSADAAYTQWGDSWRIPTKMEWDELLEKCSWEWTNIKGVNGYRITAKNGNWIFLPAAGSRYGTSVYYVDSIGYYWSSTLKEHNSSHAYYLYFIRDGKHTSSNYRDYGRSVRPVTE